MRHNQILSRHNLKNMSLAKTDLRLGGFKVGMGARMGQGVEFVHVKFRNLLSFKQYLQRKINFLISFRNFHNHIGHKIEEKRTLAPLTKLLIHLLTMKGEIFHLLKEHLLSLGMRKASK